MENKADYGPLSQLIGTWQGSKGLDIAPEEDGTEERNQYYETITFEEAGSITNAEKQTLSVLRYHQIVQRKSDAKILHNEVGFWIWDKQSKTVIRSFTIPRAVAIVAGGIYEASENSEVVLKVSAAAEGSEWEIAQSPFMKNNAKTVSFESKFKINGNKLTFYQKTVLDIYGKIFDHIDENELELKK